MSVAGSLHEHKQIYPRTTPTGNFSMCQSAVRIVWAGRDMLPALWGVRSQVRRAGEHGVVEHKATRAKAMTVGTHLPKEYSFYENG